MLLLTKKTKCTKLDSVYLSINTQELAKLNAFEIITPESIVRRFQNMHATSGTRILIILNHTFRRAT